jgi:hypothetical protein
VLDETWVPEVGAAIRKQSIKMSHHIEVGEIERLEQDTGYNVNEVDQFDQMYMQDFGCPSLKAKSRGKES